jgi:hypothetical protein
MAMAADSGHSNVVSARAKADNASVVCVDGW